ncbi:MAG: ATP-binding cassette domain-containing protein [bacterium]
MALLNVNDVSIRRKRELDGKVDEIELISNVSFSLNSSELFTIIGPSGTGKSSLLRTLNRLDEISSGEILYKDINIRKYDPVQLRRKIAYVSQTPVIFDATVSINMAYPLVAKGEKLKKDAAISLLEEMGLSAEFLERNGRELSGGQAHRVAIARSLTLSPDILLLDEPTSALDQESSEIIISMLNKRINTTDLTVIIVTHDMKVAQIASVKTLKINNGTAAVIVTE